MMLRNAHELRAHEGELFQHWRRRGAASYGAVLLDDAERES
jgi:hypothetical protein